MFTFHMYFFCVTQLSVNVKSTCTIKLKGGGKAKPALSGYQEAAACL